MIKKLVIAFGIESLIGLSGALLIDTTNMDVTGTVLVAVAIVAVLVTLMSGAAFIADYCDEGGNK